MLQSTENVYIGVLLNNAFLKCVEVTMIPNFTFTPPNFSTEKFNNSLNVVTEPCVKAGVAPENFYLTRHLPTYYKVADTWHLPKHNSQNCVAVLQNAEIMIKEIRELEVGDEVICVSDEEQSLLAQGIYVAKDCYDAAVYNHNGHAVETSSTSSYNLLVQLMQEQKENKGHILWVLGPSVVFDYDTRIALEQLAEAGYVNGLLAGNAMATHDLEGGYLGTALGQNIYTQETVPMGHYNHLDLLNEVRHSGSINNFIAQGHVKDGFMKRICELNIPYVLAGSIRDDGPLPEVIHEASNSLAAMKELTDKATLIICLATMLHSVATANLASSYRIDEEGNVHPVFFYIVDVTENVVRKVSAARENFATRTHVTNVQDFIVRINRALLGKPQTDHKNQAKENA